MGQHDVLEWLRAKRDQGDDKFRSYSEIHKAMLHDGLSVAYRSVWWSVTCLFNQGLLEAQARGGILSRKWVFRSKQTQKNVFLKLTKDYNTLPGKRKTASHQEVRVFEWLISITKRQ